MAEIQRDFVCDLLAYSYDGLQRQGFAQQLNRQLQKRDSDLRDLNFFPLMYIPVLESATAFLARLQ
jgi:hypothetical protein